MTVGRFKMQLEQYLEHDARQRIMLSNIHEVSERGSTRATLSAPCAVYRRCHLAVIIQKKFHLSQR